MNPKRTPSQKKEWLDFKVFLYGFIRTAVAVRSSEEVATGFDKKFKADESTKIFPFKYPKNRKNYFWMFNLDSNDKITDHFEVKVEGVKKTIKMCVKQKIYWKMKKSIFKNIIELDPNDDKNKDDIIKEINDYNRSITS